MMPFRSRQAKKLSRAVQQWARDWRLGASKAPSGEGVGFVCVGGGDEEERRPIVRVGERRGVGKGDGWLGGWVDVVVRRVDVISAYCAI